MPRADRAPLAGSLGVFGTALAARGAFALYAPRVLTGDDYFYVVYAKIVLSQGAYLDVDGTPAIFWMPGWPAALAAIFAVFGLEVDAAIAFQVLADSACALLLALLGVRLLGVRAGLAAGFVYALWPGNVYLAATLMVEPVFNALLAAELLLFAAALAADGSRRAALVLSAGAGLGLCALFKAEAPALLAGFTLCLWLARSGARRFAVELALLGLGAALLLGPWAVRNRAVADRWLVTSAAGGLNFRIGNRPGATGTNDFGFETRFRQLNQRESMLATHLAMNDAGWRKGLRFVREHPGEALAAVPAKLWHTYATDAAAMERMGGPPEELKDSFGDREGKARLALSPEARRWLERLANVYWFAALTAAAIGAWRLRTFPPPTRALLLAVPATWLAIHAVFLGNPRFHAPETLAFALLAGLALAREGET